MPGCINVGRFGLCVGWRARNDRARYSSRPAEADETWIPILATTEGAQDVTQAEKADHNGE
jgi:hypothetical protein